MKSQRFLTLAMCLVTLITVLSSVILVSAANGPTLVRSFDSYDEGITVVGAVDGDFSYEFAPDSNYKNSGADPEARSIKVKFTTAFSTADKIAKLVIDVPEERRDWTAYANGWVSFYIKTAGLNYAEGKKLSLGVFLVDGNGTRYAWPVGTECDYKFITWDNGMVTVSRTSPWRYIGLDPWLDRNHAFSLADYKEFDTMTDPVVLSDIRKVELAFKADAGLFTADSSMIVDDILLMNEFSNRVPDGAEIEADGMISWDPLWPWQEAPLAAPQATATPTPEPTATPTPTENPQTADEGMPAIALLGVIAAAIALVVLRKRNANSFR